MDNVDKYTEPSLSLKDTMRLLIEDGIITEIEATLMMVERRRQIQKSSYTMTTPTNTSTSTTTSTGTRDARDCQQPHQPRESRHDNTRRTAGSQIVQYLGKQADSDHTKHHSKKRKINVVVKNNIKTSLFREFKFVFQTGDLDINKDMAAFYFHHYSIPPQNQQCVWEEVRYFVIPVLNIKRNNVVGTMRGFFNGKFNLSLQPTNPINNLINLPIPLSNSLQGCNSHRRSQEAFPGGFPARSKNPRGILHHLHLPHPCSGRKVGIPVEE